MMAVSRGWAQTITITDTNGMDITFEGGEVTWTESRTLPEPGSPGARFDTEPRTITMTGTITGGVFRNSKVPTDLAELYNGWVWGTMVGDTGRQMARDGVWVPPVSRGTPDDNARWIWTWRDSQRRFRSREGTP